MDSSICLLPVNSYKNSNKVITPTIVVEENRIFLVPKDEPVSNITFFKTRDFMLGVFFG